MAKIDLYNHKPFPETIHRWGWNGVSALIAEHFHDNNAKVMLDAMIEDRAVSGEKIQQEIGFQPTTDLNAGWRKVVEELSMNN